MSKQVVIYNGKEIGHCSSNNTCYEANGKKGKEICTHCSYLIKKEG